MPAQYGPVRDALPAALSAGVVGPVMLVLS